MVPWRPDSAGRPPDVEVMAEVEAVLGIVLGVEAPAEGFRRLVSRHAQGAGAVIARGKLEAVGQAQGGCSTECTLYRGSWGCSRQRRI